jgi:hypothetical protein
MRSAFSYGVDSSPPVRARNDSRALRHGLRLGAFLALVVACNGSTLSLGESPEDEFYLAFFKLDCAQRTLCCDRLGRSNQACEARDGRHWFSGRPARAFDPAAGAACLEAIKAWDYCGPGDHSSLGPPECSSYRIFAGPAQAIGERCYHDEDCSQEDGPARCRWSVCEKTPVLGQPCSQEQEYERCSENEGLRCEAGVWTACSPVGHACRFWDPYDYSSMGSYECTAGAACVFEIPTPPDSIGACTPLTPLGGDCSQVGCIAGAYCTPSNVCAEAKPAGAECGESGARGAECQVGLQGWCSAGRCDPRLVCFRATQ